MGTNTGVSVVRAQQVLQRPVNFTLVPSLSNWTWLAPNSSSNSYVSVTAQPRSFGLQGYLSATITACSADPSSVNATQVQGTVSWPLLLVHVWCLQRHSGTGDGWPLLEPGLHVCQVPPASFPRLAPCLSC